MEGLLSTGPTPSSFFDAFIVLCFFLADATKVPEVLVSFSMLTN